MTQFVFAHVMAGNESECEFSPKKMLQPSCDLKPCRNKRCGLPAVANNKDQTCDYNYVINVV